MDSAKDPQEARSAKQLRPRSLPSQARSRQRVDIILDVTEKLVQKKGYEVVTAQMIAAATNISPGVLYHYFPGKHGIFAAVVQRAFERLEALLRQIVDTEPDHESYEAFVDRVVDALVVHWRTGRSAMLLWQALEHAPYLLPITAELKRRAIERNCLTLKRHFPGMRPRDIRMKALIMQAISFTLLRESLLVAPKDRDQLIRETKLLLVTLGRD
jgi:AcrR family transcriptional regulator